MKQRESEGGKIGTRAAHLTIAKVTTLMISLISSMLLSRFRTLGEYGTYSQLTISIMLATSLIMFGLPNSVSYFLSRADTSEERKNFLSTYYSLSTIMSFIVGVILLTAIPMIEAFFKNETISEFEYFLALYPWTQITISAIGNVLVVYGKTKLLMLINVIYAFIALLSILLIQLLGFSFKDYITFYLVGLLILSIWIYFIVYRLENGLSFRLNNNTIKVILNYAIPIGLATLIGTINIEVDKLMIGGLIGTEALAFYTNAGKELPLTLVATSLTAVLLPQLARMFKHNEKAGAITLWGDAIQLSYIVICFFATACIVFAPQIITLLYSQKYLPGVQVFRVYSLVLLLRTTYFGIILNSIGKTKLILWSSISSLCLNAVLNYLMYLQLGFVGPAIATFASILLINMLQLYFTSHTIAIPFSSIFPWKKLGQITFINALWGTATFKIVQIASLGSDVNSITICVAIVMFVLVIYALMMKKQMLVLWNNLNQIGQKYS